MAKPRKFNPIKVTWPEEKEKQPEPVNTKEIRTLAKETEKVYPSLKPVLPPEQLKQMLDSQQAMLDYLLRLNEQQLLYQQHLQQQARQKKREELAIRNAIERHFEIKQALEVQDQLAAKRLAEINRMIAAEKQLADDLLALIMLE